MRIERALYGLFRDAERPDEPRFPCQGGEGAVSLGRFFAFSTGGDPWIFRSQKLLRDFGFPTRERATSSCVASYRGRCSTAAGASLPHRSMP